MSELCNVPYHETPVLGDIVIYNKKNLCGRHQHFWHRAPIIIVSFLSDESNGGVLYVNEVISGLTSGWRLVASGAIR